MLSRFNTYVILTCLTVLYCSCTVEDITTNHPTVDLTIASQTNWELAGQILKLINDHRAQGGLNPIQLDSLHATAYAVQHSTYMIETNTVNHTNFYKRSLGLKKLGAQVVAENVAYGYATAESVVRAWLNSSKHKTVLEGDYIYSGIGIISNTEGKFYYTQLFYK